jgi:hypothetical protein
MAAASVGSLRSRHSGAPDGGLGLDGASAGLGWRVAVGRQAHLLRRACKQQVRDHPHGERHDGADGRRRNREAKRANGGNPEW